MNDWKQGLFPRIMNGSNMCLLTFLRMFYIQQKFSRIILNKTWNMYSMTNPCALNHEENSMSFAANYLIFIRIKDFWAVFFLLMKSRGCKFETGKLLYSRKYISVLVASWQVAWFPEHFKFQPSGPRLKCSVHYAIFHEASSLVAFQKKLMTNCAGQRPAG